MHLVIKTSVSVRTRAPLLLMSPQAQLEVHHMLQLVTFMRNTSTDWNVTLRSLPPSLTTCTITGGGPHRTQETLQQDLGLTGGVTDHLPLLGFSKPIRCVGWVTVWHLPAVGASLLSLSPELRGWIYPTLMSTASFLPVPGTGLTGSEPLYTMFTTKKQWWLARLQHW